VAPRLKPSAIPAVPRNREQRRRVKIDRGMDTPPGAGRPSMVVSTHADTGLPEGPLEVAEAACRDRYTPQPLQNTNDWCNGD